MWQIYDVKSIRTFLAVALIMGLSACSSSTKAEPAFVPDMTGMNLQAAQDCLQELGFWKIDDQPAAGESRFQINDSNWTVTDQNVQGEVESINESIVLYARNTGGDGRQSCP